MKRLLLASSLLTGLAFAGIAPAMAQDSDAPVGKAAGTFMIRGRVIDYAIPTGDSGIWLKNPEMKKAVENSLLFMSFKPASFFGQPASDTIRITLRRSHIEVKG